MSSYKSFAVAGVGAVGKFIVGALLEKKNEGVISSVIVLTRSVSCHPHFSYEARSYLVLGRQT